MVITLWLIAPHKLNATSGFSAAESEHQEQLGREDGPEPSEEDASEESGRQTQLTSAA